MLPYGAPVHYGEGKHPGIDYDVRSGTPIIAATDGEVLAVGMSGTNSWEGGLVVRVLNADLIIFYTQKLFCSTPCDFAKT